MAFAVRPAVLASAVVLLSGALVFAAITAAGSESASPVAPGTTPAPEPNFATSTSTTTTTNGSTSIPDEALEQDAEQYARELGIPIEQAKEQLRQQAASPIITQQLRAVAPDRLAGTWVEHQPRFRIVAWFTGPDQGLDEAHRIATESAIPVEIRTGALHTVQDLAAVLMRAVATVDDEQLSGSAVNQKAGTVVIYILDDSHYAGDPDGLAARLESEFGVPFEVTFGPRWANMLPAQ